MPYNKKLNLRFIHIPKNAGTSICKYFRMQGEGEGHHVSYNESDELQSMPTFCIVRDPIERFISNYCYARMPDSYWHGKNGMHPDYELLKGASVTECIELLKEGKLNHQGWKPQYHYVYHNNKIYADYIINSKNLNEGIEKMCKELGIEYKERIPHINKSSSVSLTLTERVEIQRIYQKDYEIFKL